MRFPVILAILFLIACGNKQVEVTTDSDTPPSEITNGTQQNETNLSRTIYGKVVHISDGDTLIIEDFTGYKTVIRLSGIDAPESDQSYGNVAKKTLENLVANRDVTVATSKKDQYGRSVGKVTIGKRDICLEMIWLGMAWHFKRYEDEQPPPDRVSYAKAELKARKVRSGLWRVHNPISPWEFRDAERVKEAQLNSNTNNQQNH